MVQQRQQREPEPEPEQLESLLGPAGVVQQQEKQKAGEHNASIDFTVSDLAEAMQDIQQQP